MANREILQRCAYVISAYQVAQEYYERSLAAKDYILGKEDSRRHLAEAAQVLCRTLARLVEEPALYDGLESLPKDVENRKQEVREIFADLECFLELEHRVLLDAGLSHEAASRLVADTSRSMRMVEGLPDIDQLQNLRERLAASRDIVCAAEQRLVEPISPRSFGRFLGALKAVGIGLSVVGGVAVIVANAMTSTVMPIFIASAGGGLASIGGGIVVLKS